MHKVRYRLPERLPGWRINHVQTGGIVPLRDLRRPGGRINPVQTGGIVLREDGSCAEGRYRPPKRPERSWGRIRHLETVSYVVTGMLGSTPGRLQSPQFFPLFFVVLLDLSHVYIRRRLCRD